MGSFAGFARIADTLGQAKELQQAEAERKRKLDLEETYQKIQQAYARTNQQRFGLEQSEFDFRKKLANQPKFVGFRNIGDRVVYGVQNPDGSVEIKEAPGGPDSGEEQSAIEQSIQSLPANAQDIARSAVYPYIVSGQYKGARDALKPILQQYAKNTLPQPTKVTETDTTQNVVLDTPQGPKIVAVPKHTTTRTNRNPGVAATGKPSSTSASGVAAATGLPTGAHVIGSKPASRAEISKVIDPLGDADRRYKVMLDSVAHPNPQSDVALLFNHIGMTLSAQRGARITQAEIQRAIDSRSVPEDLLALYTKVLNGQFLTPEQRQNMLDLGKRNRDYIWQQGWEKAKVEGLANKIPRTLSGLPPVAGIHYSGEDVTLKDGRRARIGTINPDGTYEVKVY